MSKIFQTPPPAGNAVQSPRIGIFRRIAVERYSGALDPQRPELLRPWPLGALLLAMVLGLIAIGLLGVF